ncbi:MAG: hypothetical protein AAGA55_03295 [Planctomycetota bacterium]
MGKSSNDPNMAFLEEAALRNAPLSMCKPDLLGREPMPRGRFLAPENGSIVVENLQVPGRKVDVAVGAVLEAFFQHEGRLFNFRSRVLEMDAPVQLNGAMMVRGMKISVPKRIEAGNRRQIYRQSFASINPPVEVSAWAVPRSALTPQQTEWLGSHEDDQGIGSGAGDPAGAGDFGGTEFLIERSESTNNQLASSSLVPCAIPGLGLNQLGPLMRTAAHWRGEIADASEFGIGLTLHDVVYSRLKIFQPLAVRFTLPDSDRPMEFLFEVRRVQSLKSGARLGGLLIINAKNLQEVRSSRDLAAFALQIQRERVRSRRAA